MPFSCYSKPLMNSSFEFGMSRLGLLRDGVTLRVETELLKKECCRQESAEGLILGSIVNIVLIREMASCDAPVPDSKSFREF